MTLKILILSSAKLREPSLVERFGYYSKLLKSRWPITCRQVKPNRLLSQIPDDWTVIALDERGEQLNSRKLASRIERQVRLGKTGIAFIVGEADGLTDEVKHRADWLLSLSQLTLPHQLCFVVLAEQMYRAMTIIQGGKYHRD